MRNLALASIGVCLLFSGCSGTASIDNGSGTVGIEHPDDPAASPPQTLSEGEARNAGAIIMLHGNSQNPSSLMDEGTPMGQFKRIAQQNNMRLVAPSARLGFWNDCSSHLREASQNDEADLIDMITRVRSELPQGSPIYVVGVSNGAGMAARLMRHHPEAVTAVAMVIGSYPSQALDKCRDAPGAVPVIQINGDADPLIPWSDGLTPLEGRHEGAVKTSDSIARRNGVLHITPETFSLGESYSLESPNVACSTRADPFNARSTSTLCRVSLGGHLEPSIAAPYPPASLLLGLQNRRVETADLIWDFWVRVAPSS